MRQRIRKGGKLVWVSEFEFDPSPLYTVEERADGTFDHSSAFDPKHGPESEAQIEYHTMAGHIDTTDWEVGKPL